MPMTVPGDTSPIGPLVCSKRVYVFLAFEIFDIIGL
jgi:hypothetical protein